MDKLKPIIEHRFWILFLIAMLLPFIGWWSASGALKSEFESRKSSLDSTLNGIPSGTNAPNADWESKVVAENDQRTKENVEAQEHLWNEQLTLLEWPKSIEAAMQKAPYRGEITKEEDANLATAVPDLYRQVYELEIEELWRLAEPLGNLDGPQKLELSYDAIPRHPDSRRWETDQPPSWQQIWDAQEDIWLLTEIFQAIRNVNENTENVADSHIKKIDRISLAGGNRETAGSSESGGGGGLTRSLRKDSGALLAIVDFDLAEEFGSAVGKATDEESGKEVTIIRRYVDETEKFRTRAFYLKVRMDHHKLPKLLAELANSRWPTEIVRVQQVATSEDAAPGRSVERQDDEKGDGNVGRPGAEDEGKVSELALTGPNMAVVTIAGLMTLYNPPQAATPEEGAPQGEGGDGAQTPTDASGGTPAADGAAPPDGGAVPPGAAPPPGAATPPPGAEAPPGAGTPPPGA